MSRFVLHSGRGVDNIRCFVDSEDVTERVLEAVITFKRGEDVAVNVTLKDKEDPKKKTVIDNLVSDQLTVTDDGKPSVTEAKVAETVTAKSKK